MGLVRQDTDVRVEEVECFHNFIRFIYTVLIGRFHRQTIRQEARLQKCR